MTRVNFSIQIKPALNAMSTTNLLCDIQGGKRPVDAALAVAGPVIGDRVVMMNSPWGFSLDAMRQHFGWSKLYAINDFAANALSVPLLSTEHLLQIGDGTPGP